MTNFLTLIFIGAILIAVYTFVVLQFGGGYDYSRAGDGGEGGDATRNGAAAEHPRQHQQRSVDRNPSRSQPSGGTNAPQSPLFPPPGHEQSNRPPNKDNPTLSSGSGHFQRPGTPVHAGNNNHYRPVTPLRPPTPHTPIPDNRDEQKTQHANSNNNDKAFKSYDELTAAEKEKVVDLNRCVVDVQISKFRPLLDAIGAKGDGGAPVDRVIVYFNKKFDKQLTVTEKAVRKSFKIKHPQNSELFRFARMRVVSFAADAHYYRLQFLDYTPYTEERPRYDVSKHELSPTDRTQWEVVDADLHYNSMSIKTKQMSVLLPAKGN